MSSPSEQPDMTGVVRERVTTFQTQDLRRTNVEFSKAMQDYCDSVQEIEHIRARSGELKRKKRDAEAVFMHSLQTIPELKNHIDLDRSMGTLVMQPRASAVPLNEEYVVEALTKYLRDTAGLESRTGAPFKVWATEFAHKIFHERPTKTRKMYLINRKSSKPRT